MRNKLPDLKLIEKRVWNIVTKTEEYKKFLDRTLPLGERVQANAFDYYVFPQMWGSTALGFEGIGGDAMTIASTVIAYNSYTKFALVFFGEEFAYLVKDPNESFFKDKLEENMKPCWEAKGYSDKADNVIVSKYRNWMEE